ncbi:MAG: cellulase family glycosylhydrolase [Marinilabiliaceae bacterium]
MLSALLSLATISCKDDSAPEVSGPEADTSIVLSQDSVVLSKSGGTVSVKITTNASPVTAESNAGWLSVSLSVGEPSVLTLSADVNGYSERSTTVTVSCGEAQKELRVIQRPEDLLEPLESTKINGVLQPLYPDWQGVEIMVNYETNGVPTVDMPWWIREVSSVKLKGDTVSAKYRVLKNYGKARTGKITFTLGEKSFSCQIEQKKTKFDFSNVDKSASEVANAFRCGWTFTGINAVASVENLGGVLLDVVAADGINVVRIPFSAGGDVVTEQVVASLKNAVEAVTSRKVDDENIFVILSLNNDSWLMDNLSNPTDTANTISSFENVWSLVADAFAEYDYHVIFEAYDHIAYSQNKADIAVYNSLNQTFVNAVRRSGANNFKRCLIIPGGEYESGVYAPMPDDDENTDRLLASFPFFQPLDYTKPDATKKFWGTEYSQETTDWSTYSEDDITKALSYLHSKQPRVPVVINSCGAIAHSSANDDLYAASEAAYIGYVAKAAKAESFTPIVFDDAVCGLNSYGIFSLSSEAVSTQRELYLKAFVEGSGYTYPSSDKK